MLFNSPVYLFFFLPVVVWIYFLLNRWRFAPAATVWLVMSSLFFYAYWNTSYLLIIVSSILINFTFGTMLHQTGKKRFSLRRYRFTHKVVLLSGVLFNIGLLGYFKYADFFLGNINGVFGTSYPLPNLVLPLAISFFTFQQIAYLVDCSRENANEYDFLNYCLFVSFFPQLIAGPIVHHQEMMPQFARLRNRIFSYQNMALGIFFFSMGLFKKVWIADQFSIWASMGFDSASALSFFDAWGASLSYTFQLYFDFSGYADMAIGSALFFNIILPINFNSPYKAGNIQEFWRRWHMTLSRWLREYLYIPMGGNRKGSIRTYTHLFLTFLLAGLWHGAGWTFVLWGVLHGIALVVHRVWSKLGMRMPGMLGWSLTFLFVNASWVVFRATTLEGGLRVLKGMCGLNGFMVTSTFTDLFQQITFIHQYLHTRWVGSVSLPSEMYWYLLCFAIVLFLLPNTCQVAGFTGMFDEKAVARDQRGFRQSSVIRFFCSFKPNCYWALFSGIVFSMAMYRLLRVAPTEFLYFNF